MDGLSSIPHLPLNVHIADQTQIGEIDFVDILPLYSHLFFLQTFNHILCWSDHSLVNTCSVLCCMSRVQTMQDALSLPKHGNCQEKGLVSY